jgi:hypothetical protein
MAVNDVEDTLAMKEELARTGRVLVLRLKEGKQPSAEAHSNGGEDAPRWQAEDVFCIAVSTLFLS